MKSPYLFVIRSINVENSNLTSPMASDLDRLAGPPAPVTAPGDTPSADAPPPKGPQYLFGNSILKVKIRVDMIEWKAQPIK